MATLNAKPKAPQAALFWLLCSEQARQKKDLLQHKVACKEIARLEKIVGEEEGKLRHLCWSDGRNKPAPAEGSDKAAKSALEACAGAFGPRGIKETCEHVAAWAELAKHCNALTFMSERPTPPAWANAALAFQERAFVSAPATSQALEAPSMLLSSIVIMMPMPLRLLNTKSRARVMTTMRAMRAICAKSPRREAGPAPMEALTATSFKRLKRSAVGFHSFQTLLLFSLSSSA